MNKHRIIPFIAVALLIASCGSRQEQPAKKTAPATRTEDQVTLNPQEIRNAGITTGPIGNRDMQATLQVNGTVAVPPQNIVSISMPIGGYIRKMNMVEGMHVGKGAVLATLEDQQYIKLQQDYLLARTKEEQLQKDFVRQQGLNQTLATSDKTFQQVQQEYKTQQIMVRSLAEQLRLIGIDPAGLRQENISRSVQLRAPIAGYVTNIRMNTGKYVMPSDVLLELIDPGDLHVELTVFEKDALKLQKGQKVLCSTNTAPDETFPATVVLVTPKIGDNRATEVHCELDRPDKRLLPGTFINARIELNKEQVKAVPDAALVKWENKEYLFGETGQGRFRMVPVVTGKTGGGFTEIRSEVPYARIITQNAYSALMKMKNGGEE